jgi:hypothetical protein
MVTMHRHGSTPPARRGLDDVVRAKRPKHLPIVLPRDKVRAVITKLHGTRRLMATLLSP